MALDKLKFTKDWNNPEDFPTIELDETKVRSDMQFLYDETKKFLNEKLIPSLESCGVETTVQRLKDSGLKYIRLNSEGEFETSEDGNTWSRPPVPKDLIESDVFFATYGTTTNAEILAAYEAGKAVYVKDVPNISRVVFPITRVDSISAVFSMFLTNGIQRAVECLNDQWRTYDPAYFARIPESVKVTLLASDWDASSKELAVGVPGVSSDETKQLITVTPAVSSQRAYYRAGIRCDNQSTDTLFFIADEIPASDLDVYVTIQEVRTS